VLEKINCIEDLKRLDRRELPALCAEIRQFLVENVSATGGHLASNLGIVELTVALHYIFDADDKFIFDVGHQSYVHKILTGRRELFGTLRQKDGLSGFTDPQESAYDASVSGHASTAISTALGMATARDALGEDYNVIAIVGDGSLTGGLSYEALNNIRSSKMLIVFNDNNMSINKNVGSLSRNVSKIRVGKYDQRKQRAKRVISKIPLLGKPLYKFLRWCKRTLTWMLLHNNYFEVFDLKYVGVIDGHDMKDLLYFLSRIKQNVAVPTVLHVATQKGKGFVDAENDPSKYHSVATYIEQKTASSVVDETLTALAAEDDRIVAITAAMTDGVGLCEFAKVHPDRFFDVGIAESHAVTFAGGLAAAGMHPYVAIYSTFMQRAYDQIVHDVAIAGLPVTFLIDRSGLAGSDGKTHQGLMDLSFLGSIPNVKIWTPATYSELKAMIMAAREESCPVAIRYSKVLSDDDAGFNGKWRLLHTGGKIKVLAVGSLMCRNAMAARALCSNPDDVEVVAVTTVKPLDSEYLNKIDASVVITLEENQLTGGFGSQIAQYFAGNDVKVINMAVADKFVKHATISQQAEEVGLDVKAIAKIIDNIT
jgi:1-deoxy-D-xylulose-5-phosphate synthase